MTPEDCAEWRLDVQQYPEWGVKADDVFTGNAADEGHWAFVNLLERDWPQDTE